MIDVLYGEITKKDISKSIPVMSIEASFESIYDNFIGSRCSFDELKIYFLRSLIGLGCDKVKSFRIVKDLQDYVHSKSIEMSARVHTTLFEFSNDMLDKIIDDLSSSDSFWGLMPDDRLNILSDIEAGLMDESERFTNFFKTVEGYNEQDDIM